MKLTKSFERLRNKQNQVIELSCEVSTRNDIDDIPYDEFKADLFINGKFVGDISPVLDNADVLVKMIDDVDWFEIYDETKDIYEIRKAI